MCFKISRSGKRLRTLATFMGFFLTKREISKIQVIKIREIDIYNSTLGYCRNSSSSGVQLT
jgi:hypothetical protein